MENLPAFGLLTANSFIFLLKLSETTFNAFSPCFLKPFFTSCHYLHPNIINIKKMIFSDTKYTLRMDTKTAQKFEEETSFYNCIEAIDDRHMTI